MSRHEKLRKQRSSSEFRICQRYKVEMGLLSQMSSLLQHAVDHKEAYGIVTAFGEKLLPCRNGTASVAVYTSRASQNALECQASWGTVRRDRFQPDACWALRRSQTHYVGHRQGSPAFPRCAHGPPSGWSLCVPMSASGQTIGLIAVSGENELSSAARGDIERVARAVADQLALAINNLNLRKSLRALAIRDPLTGLFNRRHMEESVTREHARAKRNNSNLSVLMIDIDHFKRFNDTRGHQAADEALARVGEQLQAHFRDSDIVCRYGGEEFLVVLPDCKKAHALSQAQKLCKRIREYPLEITVSIGVAEFPSDGQLWEIILRRADAALYQAKANGRDCVSAAESHEEGNQLATPANTSN